MIRNTYSDAKAYQGSFFVGYHTNTTLQYDIIGSFGIWDENSGVDVCGRTKEKSKHLPL